jgi:hypothetical protein
VCRGWFPPCVYESLLWTGQFGQRVRTVCDPGEAGGAELLLCVHMMFFASIQSWVDGPAAAAVHLEMYKAWSREVGCLDRCPYLSG